MTPLSTYVRAVGGEACCQCGANKPAHNAEINLAHADAV